MKVDTDELKIKAVATTRVVGSWLKEATPKVVAHVKVAGNKFAKSVAEHEAKLKEEK